MSGHDHHHHHDHDHDNHFTPIEARVKALESLMVEKGYVDPSALDAIIDTYETKIGPRNGARVVAKAWSDPAYAARLKADGTAAVASRFSPKAKTGSAQAFATTRAPLRGPIFVS